MGAIDVEAATPAMLERGSQFFADIERHQVDAAGRQLLRFLAQRGERARVNPATLTHAFPDPERLQQTLALLIRCELIEVIDHNYRFQVEAIRRWFAHSTL